MTFLTILLALLPGIVWLLFYLQEDRHPEPKRLLALVFLLGMVWAVIAFVAEKLMNPILLGIGGGRLTVFALVVLALVEELAKFAAAYLTVYRSRAFDEPVDAMIYMVVAALGFATVENIGAVHATPEGLTLLGNIFETISFRFVGATLLHVLASALVGFYWAKSIRGFGARSILLRGIVFATILHSFFNYLILSYGNIAYAIIAVVIVGFFMLNDFEKLRTRNI